MYVEREWYIFALLIIPTITFLFPARYVHYDVSAPSPSGLPHSTNAQWNFNCSGMALPDNGDDSLFSNPTLNQLMPCWTVELGRVASYN